MAAPSLYRLLVISRDGLMLKYLLAEQRKKSVSTNPAPRVCLHVPKEILKASTVWLSQCLRTPAFYRGFLGGFCPTGNGEGDFLTWIQIPSMQVTSLCWAQEAPINFTGDPCSCRQTSMYSRYLLRPPCSAFWAALTMQVPTQAFPPSCGLLEDVQCPFAPIFSLYLLTVRCSQTGLSSALPGPER